MPSGAIEAIEEKRRLISAVWVIGSATLLTVLLGVATTKVIALVAGPAGIALVGLYRSLAALISRPLLFGLDTTLVQRISTAKDVKTSTDTVGATFLAAFLQGVVVAAIGLACAGFIGRSLFSVEPTGRQVTEIRVVLGMAYANLVVQLMTALLSARVEVRKVARVGVVSAVVTLIAIYPLLQLGHLGIALNVGSGSTVGAVLATFFVWRTYGSSWTRTPVRVLCRALRTALVRSTFLTLHPLVMMVAVLSVQSLILGRYTLEGLGAYNAAANIVDTALVVIMSSARTFFLPTLGNLENQEDKAAAVNRALRLNLILCTAATLVAIVAAPVMVPMLFTGRFDRSIAILPAFSLGMVGQAFVWSYAMFYLHKGRYRLFFTLDLIWATAYVGLTFLAVSGTGSLTAVAWAYAASYAASGVVYTVVAVRVFGARMLDHANLRLGLIALLGSLGALALHELDQLLLDVGVLAAGLAALSWVFLRSFARPPEGTQ